MQHRKAPVLRRARLDVKLTAAGLSLSSYVRWVLRQEGYFTKGVKGE